MAIPVCRVPASPARPFANCDDDDRNLETRKETREKAWQVDGWSDTVHKVSNFVLSQINLAYMSDVC